VLWEQRPRGVIQWRTDCKRRKRLHRERICLALDRLYGIIKVDVVLKLFRFRSWSRRSFSRNKSAGGSFLHWGAFLLHWQGVCCFLGFLCRFSGWLRKWLLGIQKLG